MFADIYALAKIWEICIGEQAQNLNPRYIYLAGIIALMINEDNGDSGLKPEAPIQSNNRPFYDHGVFSERLFFIPIGI